MRALLLLTVLIVPSTTATAQQAAPVSEQRGCEAVSQLPGLVWRGTSSTLTFQQLAAYAAPIYWLSPDEPTLRRTRGGDIRVPAPFPFEQKVESPVVYYQVTSVVSRPDGAGPAMRTAGSDKAQFVVNLESVAAIRIKYTAYFPEEAGVGQHPHDVEPAEFRFLVGRANGSLLRREGIHCDASDFVIVVTRVIGEAHGNAWYYNVLEVDRETALPIHLLVEEGKHAMATDKNGDGYYTPGYDVSVRVNDAWGVRDTVRGGTLFSGAFQAWMAKVRQPQHRVLPPLPRDSQLYARMAEHGIDASQLAVYQLRPYPASSLATDKTLREKIAEKETRDWPVATTGTTINPVLEALAEGRDLKPFSFAYRNDGTHGIALSFPLLVIKNVPEPLTGGYLVNRIFLRAGDARSWGWNLMYTPSASRWFDQYLAAGLDVIRVTDAEGVVDRKPVFTAETGFKFRFRAPISAMNVLTPFWGVRMGVKSMGALDIEGLTFIFEIGGGVW